MTGAATVTEFPCIRCGACCRAVQCPKLAADNTCSIYETRPQICRLSALAPEKPHGWWLQNLMACAALIQREPNPNPEWIPQIRKHAEELIQILESK